MNAKIAVFNISIKYLIINLIFKYLLSKRKTVNERYFNTELCNTWQNAASERFKQDSRLFLLYKFDLALKQ